jgi:hypothetical protein
MLSCKHDDVLVQRLPRPLRLLLQPAPAPRSPSPLVEEGRGEGECWPRLPSLTPILSHRAGRGEN